MTFLNRAMLYIVRKKGKTANLFLLFLVTAVFLISCFAVLEASKSMSAEIRTSVGAAFYLRPVNGMVMNENGEAVVTENKLHISEQDIEAILKFGGIRYYNPVNYGFAKSEQLEFLPGEGHNEESNMGKVTALRYSALAGAFADGTAELTEGAHIMPADRRTILISEQLAAGNQLAAGDQIVLTHARLSEENGEYVDEIKEKTEFITVTIGGIYRLNTEDISIVPTAGVAENEIFASLDVLSELGESEIGMYTGEVGFYITDPAMLEDIAAQVRQLPGIDWETHFIRVNDFQYAKISGQLSSIDGLAAVLLVCVSAVSTGVLILLLILRMRGRMQEAGILLAAGIAKQEIAAQFLFEVLAVAAAAFVMAWAVSFGLLQGLWSIVFEGIRFHPLNELILEAGGNAALPAGVRIKPDAGKVLVICLCGGIVIAGSTLISLITILRLNPREIFSKMS